MTTTSSSPVARALALCLLAAGLLQLGGCEAIGWVVGNAVGDKPKKVKVEAQYTGLEGKKTAVVVAADPFTLTRYPAASEALIQAVTSQLQSRVPNVKVVDPGHIAKFELENPYWTTLTYRELVTRLDVDRLIYIDLLEYSAHEPGNAHVWQGVIRGNVGVAEREKPDNLVMNSLLASNYPPGATVGVVDADSASIQVGMLRSFSDKVAALFYEHEEIRK